MMRLVGYRQGEKLYDLGGYLACWLAKPLRRIWISGDDPEEDWTLEDVRSFARDRPTESYALIAANVVRALLWASTTFAVIALWALYLAASEAVGSGPIDAVQATFRVVALFQPGLLLVSAFKWAVSWQWAWRAEEQFDHPGPGSGRILVRLCMPSNIDLGLAAVFVLAFY